MNLAAVTDAKVITAREAYQRFLFQGPRLQLIERIDGIAKDGADAEVRGPTSDAGWTVAVSG